MPFTETEFPMWVLVFKELGPGSCILVFTFAVIWKLLPALTKLLGAWHRQSEKITHAVDPVLEGVKDAVWHLERMADHVAGSRPLARDPRRPRVRNGGGHADLGGSGHGESDTEE